ncbi:MAG TPA: metallophosphoesterase [Sedimentisphaerales bacterium]|nr:metallophosphoesterase [Sedimentisphaerales bacterium]
MRLTGLLSIALAIVLSGCAHVEPGLKVEVPEKPNPWTHLKFNNNPDNFQFAIVADRTGKHRPGVFAEAVEKLNLLNPQFVMSIGDFIEGHSEDEAELNRQWNEFDGLTNKLRMPFFYVPGNHDISNAAMAEIWQKRFGRSYYHFIYRDVLFLCLNTEDTDSGYISDEQFEYFRKVINANRGVRWTLVFLHKPLWWNPETLEYWQKFVALLGHRPYTVFAGHRHTYDKSVYDGRRYYILATTGAGNKPASLDECKFDHIVWVTMTDEGPVLANLLLEGILNDEPCPQQ